MSDRQTPLPSASRSGHTLCGPAGPTNWRCWRAAAAAVPTSAASPLLCYIMRPVCAGAPVCVVLSGSGSLFTLPSPNCRLVSRFLRPSRRAEAVVCVYTRAGTSWRRRRLVRSATSFARSVIVRSFARSLG